MRCPGLCPRTASLDHGLIGDGRGCALGGRDGAVSFTCVPRFDAPPLFCSLLDRHRGGSFLLAPEGLRLSREVRTQGRPFTYSAAMCQVALDRAARLATRLHLPGKATTWATEARHLTGRIIHDAWDEHARSFTEHLGARGGLDASLLALPLRRVLPADHPRMIATTQAITERLGAGDGLLYRYLPQESPDGLQEPEGAFLLCSFWLVDNLVGQGRVDEASELFEKLCTYASPLGLFAEQIDPADRSFLGNFPQALSRVGLLSSAVVLARTQRGVRAELSTHAWFQ